MGSGATLLSTLLQPVAPKPKDAAKIFVLSSRDEPSLRAAALSDGKAYLRNACVTMADALGSLDRKGFSWACVKFYYATFYSVMAWLAFSDEVHIYLDRSPAYLLIRGGAQITRGAGNSHEFAFGRFVARFPFQAILSQDIDAEPPFAWLRHQRERIQYTGGEFCDPTLPKLFHEFIHGKSRDLLNFYSTVPDTATEYATLFDPDHAMVAVPFRLLADTLHAVRLNHSFSLTKTQLAHCKTSCRMEQNPVAVFNDLVK